MKKTIISLFIFLFIFSQETKALDFMNGNNIFNENDKEETTSDKIRYTFTFLGVGTIVMGISIGMRELVYKNNHIDNWWGTVNGAFSLALACELIGVSIPYIIYKISDGKFSENNIIFGALLGIVGGTIMAFLPPI